MPQQKIIYYAHAMCFYRTLCERRELALIRKKFSRSRIINPALYGNHPEKIEDSVGFCLRLVEKSSIVVFSRVLGKITAGVGKEVNHALKLGKEVYELQSEAFKEQRRNVEYISRARSISLYQRWWDITGGN